MGEREPADPRRPDPRLRARTLRARSSDLVAARRDAGERWLTPGVRDLGVASLLDDLGYEVTTSLLPSLLSSTLGAPAAALGVIEGIADGLGGAARLGGGALADDPHRRRAVAVGGYTATAVLSSLVGAAGSVWQVGVLRTGSWVARGLRSPARNALVADLAPREAYGRAYGFERMMDNAGAIGGPLAALGLVALVGVRTTILLSIVPGLLAALAILVAVRHAPRSPGAERRPIRLRPRRVVEGALGRLLAGVGAFELANVAATLLILRATDLLTPRHGRGDAVQIGLALYAAYNVAAAAASLPGGRAADRRGSVAVLGAGTAAATAAYAGFALTGPSVALLVVLFVLAGAAIGLVETAEHAAVAALAPEDVRGSAFGILAGVQSLGRLAASAVAGALWTLASPRVAFLYLVAWLLVALALLARVRRD